MDCLEATIKEYNITQDCDTMDCLEAIIKEYNITQNFEIVNFSTIPQDHRNIVVSIPATTCPLEVLEEVCKNLPPSSSSTSSKVGVSSTTQEELELNLLLSDTDSSDQEEEFQVKGKAVKGHL